MTVAAYIEYEERKMAMHYALGVSNCLPLKPIP